MNQILPLVSIIVIDYKNDNPYLVECLDAIQKQTYKNFEIILVCDYKVNISYPKLRQKYYGHYVGPAEKRDEGAKMAKGEILAFIDDDAFPSSRWLEYIISHFKNKEITGVGGPGVTPRGVSWREEASGWASASPVGSGMYTCRFLPGKKQFVDDYPSMNLSVRKSDFEKVGGFDSNFWPGEDTKLCLDLTHKINKKIIYEPKALVFHHRRPVWKGHLRQNGNFGLHRGFFARVLPQTSFKLIYFLPSLLLLGLIFVIVSVILYPIFPGSSILSFPTRSGIYTNNTEFVFISIRTFGLYCFAIYFFMLILNSIWIYIVIARSKATWQSHIRNTIIQSLLSVPVIFTTHLWYGARFIQGFLFTDKLTR